MARDQGICNFHAEPKLSGRMNPFQINIQAPAHNGWGFPLLPAGAVSK